MQKRKTIVVRKLVAGIKQRLNNEHCTLVTGFAKIESRTDELVTISCGDQTYEAENLMICTGSTNFVPPIPGIKENPAIWDSTDALAAAELPKSIIIVGGGVIGMEFATLYHELGVPVTVIEALPTILPNLDPEVVAVLAEKYKKAGINILTETRVEEMNGERVKANGEWYEAERILVSVGRRANLNGLEALNDIELDVTGKIMLAHVAARQAEVAVGRMLKQIPLQRIAYNAIPSVVYTNPEIASVGITEAQAADLKIETEVRKLPMTFSGRFMAENEGETGLCKMIIDAKTQMVLGVHMIGNPCSEFVAAASFAVRMGYTTAEFQQVVFPHPTVSEILHEIL